jgi:hypothetical protein
MALDRSAFADLVATNFDMIYVDIATAGAPSDAIFNTASSTQQSEKSSGMVAGGYLTEKDEGDDMVALTAHQNYDGTLTHATLAGYYEITEELLEDDQTSSIRQLERALAVIAFNTREQLRMNFLVAGFTTNGNDGSTLWATDHTSLGGGADWANRPATELDISPANWRTALSSFYQLKDHYGMAREQMPTVSLFNPDEFMYAKEIIKSAYVADSNNRNESQWQGIAEPVQSARWTDTDAWALFGDKSMHGIVQFERVAPGVQWLQGSDSDFHTGNMRGRVRARWSQGDQMSGLGTWGTTGI